MERTPSNKAIAVGEEGVGDPSEEPKEQSSPHEGSTQNSGTPHSRDEDDSEDDEDDEDYQDPVEEENRCLKDTVARLQADLEELQTQLKAHEQRELRIKPLITAIYDMYKPPQAAEAIVVPQALDNSSRPQQLQRRHTTASASSSPYFAAYMLVDGSEEADGEQSLDQWDESEEHVTLISHKGSFYVELGMKNAKFFSVKGEWRSVVDNSCWYRAYFKGRPHENFTSADSPVGPIVLSMTKERTEIVGEDHHYRAILRTRDGEKRTLVPASPVDAKFEQLAGVKQQAELVLAYINPALGAVKLRRNNMPQLAQALHSYEDKLVTNTFKFGVLYCKKGQQTEEEMFANRHDNASDDFKEFLDFLGDTVDLNRWPRFAGGLDTKKDHTGMQSVYTQWHGNQIMFHVSTLLPHNPTDSQQIEKKRHIGNDIVLIVFQDEDCQEPFSPLTIASHFIEIIVVVRMARRKTDGRPFYRIAVSTKKGLPPFLPQMPEPPVMPFGPLARDFLLAKVINGELAAYKGPSFVEKIKTSRAALLQDIVDKFHLNQKNALTLSGVYTPQGSNGSIASTHTVSGGALSSPSNSGKSIEELHPTTLVGAGSASMGAPQKRKGKISSFTSSFIKTTSKRNIDADYQEDLASARRKGK